MIPDFNASPPPNPLSGCFGPPPPSSPPGTMDAIQRGAAQVGGGAGAFAREQVENVILPGPAMNSPAFNPSQVITPISESAGAGPRMNPAASPSMQSQPGDG